MAETLGSLCDKLTIIKLKQYHADAANREIQESLSSQEFQLREEINTYVAGAISGGIPLEKIISKSNKIHTGVTANPICTTSLAGMFSVLAAVNCEIWHHQEKIYNFESVPADMKDSVIRQIAILNLQRNGCIDSINQLFRDELS
jgi:hypothetical protein